MCRIFQKDEMSKIVFLERAGPLLWQACMLPSCGVFGWKRNNRIFRGVET